MMTVVNEPQAEYKMAGWHTELKGFSFDDCICGIENETVLFCPPSGSTFMKFSEKPKKLEEWEGIVSSKQVKVPDAEKITGTLSASKEEKLKQLEQILTSLTNTKIREIAKSFGIEKIYGVKKAELVERILKELPDNIEREIRNLSGNIK